MRHLVVKTSFLKGRKTQSQATWKNSSSVVPAWSYDSIRNTDPHPVTSTTKFSEATDVDDLQRLVAKTYPT
jgi:hypothetical protein